MAPPKSPFRIDGARLRALRAERGWTKTDLWRTSGLGERTISALELGESRGSAESARTLATTFGVPIATLWVSDAPVGDAARAPAVVESATPATHAALPPPKLAARTRLDALADLERAHGFDPPPIAFGKGTLPLLTAARMQDVFATHAAFDGDRFVVTGALDSQRALSPQEARAIGAKVGLGARYHVVRDVIPGEPLGTTIHVADRALAKALQARMKREVTLVVRVVLATKDPPDDDDDARVMALFGSARRRAWGFLGERIVESVG